MSQMFDFGVDVTFAKKRKAGQVVPFFGRTTNALIMRDLRVMLDIEKTLAPEPNTCHLTIFNMNEDSRKAIGEEDVHCTVECGYDGIREQVFAGDVIWHRSRLNGETWETEVQIGDGSRAFKEAEVNRSFNPGVTLRTALKEVVTSLGLKVPRSLTGPELNAQFTSGLVLHGSAQMALTKLLNSKPARSNKDRFSWSIQDGVLQILRDSEVKRGAAILIDQEHGLVGVPESGSPPEKGKPPITSFETLLMASLIPGCTVQLDSISTKGAFKLVRVNHNGDTEGDSRRSACEGIPV